MQHSKYRRNMDLCSCSSFPFLTHQRILFHVRTESVKQVSFNLMSSNQLHWQQDLGNIRTGARQGPTGCSVTYRHEGRCTSEPTTSFTVICQNGKKKSNKIKKISVPTFPYLDSDPTDCMNSSLFPTTAYSIPQA